MATTSRRSRTPGRQRFLAGLLLFAASTAMAQYKSVGPDGRVTYSDVPPPANARILNEKPARGAVASGDQVPLPFELQQAVGKYPVTLYTGDRCQPCDDARNYLRNRGVPFAERTVTSDDDIALFKQQSPDGTAPVVTVGTRRSVGFSQVALGGLLDAAGYPATSVLPRDYRNAAATPLAPTTRAPGQNVAQPAANARTRAADPSPPPPTPAPSGPPGFRF